MEKQKNNETVSMFYGFWKHLGVMGVFLVGVTLTWWGINILLNDWATVRLSMGLIGHIVLAPLVMGLVLSWMSLAEFLRIIRED